MDKKILLLLVFATVLLAVPLAMAQEKVTVYFFYGKDCHNCELVHPLIEELEGKYPQVEFRKYEIWNNKGNWELYIDISKGYGENMVSRARGGTVPVVFISEKYYMGSSQISSSLEKEMERQLGYLEGTKDHKVKIPIPFLGEFELDLAAMPLPVLGIILGLADGINPCTMSVLIFLLAYLLSLGSRRKMLKVGIVYTVVVFIIYFLFILGIFSFMSFFGNLNPIRVAVGLVAFVAGILMVKDFFAYGKGISLGISSRAKPIIERLVKMATIPAAIILALFASLVELPCTAGFPLIYATLVAQGAVGGSLLFLYLFWYNIFYVMPLLVLIGLVYFIELEVERAERWRERSKRYMRLIGGLIMLVFGIILVFSGL